MRKFVLIVLALATIVTLLAAFTNCDRATTSNAALGVKERLMSMVRERK
jgi:hypothetical protein